MFCVPKWMVTSAVIVLHGGAGISAEIMHGPMVGHVTSDSAILWARGATPGEYELRVFPSGEDQVHQTAASVATTERDLTMTWQVRDLKPGRRYRYEIRFEAAPIGDGKGQEFSTLRDDAPVKLAFGSCAWDVSHPRQPVWTAILAAEVDAMVLLGDTPYIDSTDLKIQRQRYRDFWSIAELKTMMRQTPVYAVWDDHDFGPNDALGNIPGRENSRRAFLEYHANPSYGLDNEGVFTKFRRGPVEVFLLDTRWFGNTEASPADPDRKTLLGRKQWDWLRDGLRKSTAPVKVLACGMIWNDAAYPPKSDCWKMFAYEREGLFRQLKQDKITGVILIGGDIHRMRHLVHPTRDLVGYDLHEFITSPLAEHAAPEQNIPSPLLRYDAELKNAYLQLNIATQADGVALKADFHSAETIQHTVDIKLDDLQPRSK